MDTTEKPIGKFKGLNNVADPFRLTPDWFVQADNVDLSRTLGVQRCEGYVRRTTNTKVTGAYATDDQSRLYVVDSGELRQYLPDMTYTVLKTGLNTNAVMSFAEVNSTVFCTNGIDFGCIEAGHGWRSWGIDSPDNTTQLFFTGGSTGLPFGKYNVVTTHVDDRGMESGNSGVSQIEGQGQLDITAIPHRTGYTTNVYVTMCKGTVFHLLSENTGVSLSHNNELNLGRELPFWGIDLPRGTLPCYFQGRMCCAESYPQYDYTVIWSSLALRSHHFSYDDSGIIVPGEVRMLEHADDDSLIIGTDRQVFAYDGDKLTELASYGVVDGYPAANLGDTLFFWTLRGLCSAMPFKNLTEDKFSVAPGLRVGAALMDRDGTRRYVVALKKGGVAYNRR